MIRPSPRPSSVRWEQVPPRLQGRVRVSRRPRSATRGHPGPWIVLLLILSLAGCRRTGDSVTVYAAQDRVFAEPIFKEFRQATGIEVDPVFDNEATKTTGLANRLVLEAKNPQADVWWSNEELRTRQLVREGILEPELRQFGHRERVLVVSAHPTRTLPAALSLSTLTQPEFRGRIAMAYPIFGTTLAHLLVLRQRWGDAAWRTWCEALAANRPLLVDGNSLVVKIVARGDAWVGLTDSDDVAFGRREGLDVAAHPLSAEDGLLIPNTIARVVRAPHPDAASKLLAFLGGMGTEARLVAAGALESASFPGRSEVGTIDWDTILRDLDPSVRWLQATFVR